MKINCGIIGLPNVGKSAFFSILTNTSVKIANFPFCTIQPNIAITQILDPRIYQLASISKSKHIVHNVIEFIDIAGLIKGAAQGEGLGSKILTHIREAKVLCHVVRCFDADQITHITGNVDPSRDINIVNTELILFDILQCEKNILLLQKNQKFSNENIKQKLFLLKKCLDYLNNGILLRRVSFSHIEQTVIQKFNFLTFKPVIYVANTNKLCGNSAYYLQKLNSVVALNERQLIVSCCTISLLPYNSNWKNNCNNYVDDVIKQREYVLKNIFNNIFNVLRLHTFFTVNTRTARAWIGTADITALELAKKVHSDFKKGFIRVQVIKFKDFINYKGEIGAKNAGKVYFESKNYCTKDGDILKFLFKVC